MPTPCVVSMDLRKYEAEQDRLQAYEEWALDQEEEFRTLLDAYMNASYFHEEKTAAKLRVFVDFIISGKHEGETA